MANSDFFVGAVFFAVGAALIALYGFAVRALFGARFDFVQVILYKVNTESFPIGKRILEAILRILKFWLC